MYNHLTLQMYDLTLTTSVAKSATWGKPRSPETTTAARLQTSDWLTQINLI